MSNKHKFNVTVTVNGKDYPPGEPVTIGTGKNAISKDESDSIDKVHGTYVGKSSPAPAAATKIADLGDPVVIDAIEAAVNSAVEAVDTEAVTTLEAVETLLSTLTGDNRDAVLGDIENLLSAPSE